MLPCLCVENRAIHQQNCIYPNRDPGQEFLQCCFRWIRHCLVKCDEICNRWRCRVDHYVPGQNNHLGRDMLWLLPPYHLHTKHRKDYLWADPPPYRNLFFISDCLHHGLRYFVLVHGSLQHRYGYPPCLFHHWWDQPKRKRWQGSPLCPRITGWTYW